MGRKAKAEGRDVHIWLILFAVQQKRTHCKAVSGSLGAQSCPTLCAPRLLCPRGFPRQEYWSGWPCPPPGDLPVPGIKPTSLMTPASAGSLRLVPPLLCLVDQLCLTLCDPMDGSPSGSSVHKTLQAKNSGVSYHAFSGLKSASLVSCISR